MRIIPIKDLCIIQGNPATNHKTLPRGSSGHCAAVLITPLNGVEFTLFFPDFTLLSADQADNIFSVPPVNDTGKTEGEWD